MERTLSDLRGQIIEQQNQQREVIDRLASLKMELHMYHRQVFYFGRRIYDGVKGEWATRSQGFGGYSKSDAILLVICLFAVVN